jgi:hypothetical protein
MEGFRFGLGNYYGRRGNPLAKERPGRRDLHSVSVVETTGLGVDKRV